MNSDGTIVAFGSLYIAAEIVEKIENITPEKNIIMDKKIVVTGIGIQSCLGSSVDEYWDSLLEGKSGIRTITQVSSTDFPCKVVGKSKILNLVIG